MIVDFVNAKLEERLRQKQHEVIQLRWQKAQMEKKLENLKKRKGEQR